MSLSVLLGVQNSFAQIGLKTGLSLLTLVTHPGGVGDIELGPLVDRASAYTPVPGGVGPMTINTLIMQTVESGEKALG